jgi:transposase
VVELYLTTEISYQELALTVGITNYPLITKWVNAYRVAGPDALRAKRKGRQLKVNKPNKVTHTTTVQADNNEEYLKQLEEENLKLRIENAYLKELRRLRIEDEARLREQQESSTASEENSN